MAFIAVTVPGAVEGWYQMHQRFGKLPWKDLFHDAIAYAEQGFPVYEGVREIWAAPNIVQALAGQSRVQARVPARRQGSPHGSSCSRIPTWRARSV